MRLFLLVVACCATAARAEDFDRMTFSTNAGRLVGQVAACGGDERFVIIEKKVRRKSWDGAPALQISPIVQAFLAAEKLGQDDQASEKTGLSCDEVKARFDALAKEVEDVPVE